MLSIEEKKDGELDWHLLEDAEDRKLKEKSEWSIPVVEDWIVPADVINSNTVTVQIGIHGHGRVCQECNFLIESLRTNQKDRTVISKRARDLCLHVDQLRMRNCIVCNDIAGRWNWWTHEWGNDNWQKEILLWRAMDKTLGKGVSASKLDFSFQVPDYEQIRSWLQECHAGHRKCQILSPEARIESVRLVDCINNQIICSDFNYPYLALSYVWGPKVSSQQSFHFNDLDYSPQPIIGEVPLTIKDAITVTRELGYQYLWVDRYCVSRDGSVRHSTLASMDEIYERADATIVAFHGNNDMAGLPGVSTTPRRFEEELTLMEGLKIPEPTRITKLMKDSSSIWKTRGWTYQEAKCSQRCIFFSEGEVHFVCRDSARNELIPHLKTSDTLEKNALLIRAELSYHRWGEFQRCVFDYSGRAFTYPSDRMDAFRGIITRSSAASWWGMVLESDKKGICNDLALSAALSWQIYRGYEGVDEKVMINSPLRNKCFPSWSWTSINRTIYWDELTQLSFQYCHCGYPWGFPKFSVSIEDRTMDINTYRKLTASKVLPETSQRLMVTGDVVRLFLPQGGSRWIAAITKEAVTSLGSGAFRLFLCLDDWSSPIQSPGMNENEIDALVLAREPGEFRIVLLLLKWIETDRTAERLGICLNDRYERHPNFSHSVFDKTAQSRRLQFALQ